MGFPCCDDAHILKFVNLNTDLPCLSSSTLDLPNLEDFGNLSGAGSDRHGPLTEAGSDRHGPLTRTSGDSYGSLTRRRSINR